MGEPEESIDINKQPKRINFIGMKIGKLLVQEIVDSKYGCGYLWGCICECGNKVIKPTASLTRSIKTNVRIMCNKCVRKFRKETYVNIYSRKRKNEKRPVYTGIETDKIMKDVLEDLRREFGSERPKTMKEICGSDFIEYEVPERIDPFKDT